MRGLMLNNLPVSIKPHHHYEIVDPIIETSNLQSQVSYANSDVFKYADFTNMSSEPSFLHKQFLRKKNALNLDDKNKELQTLNEHLAMSLKDSIGEFNDNSNLLNEYKKAIDHSTIVSMTDVKGRIIYVNDAFTKVSGYTREELLGSNHNIIRHPDNRPEMYEQMWGVLLNKKPWHGVIKNLSKDGQSYYVDTTITPILDKNGEIQKFLALRYNITKAIEQERRMDQYLKDRLTGLPSRIKLIEDIENQKYKAITILNIDSFQEINDLYGQTIGDEVFKSLAIYLSRRVRKKKCYLFKLPADEFAIACDNTLDFKSYTKIIIRLIQDIDNTLFKIKDTEIHLSVTGGMSEASNNINILSHADIALKKAKLEKLPFIVYDETMQEKKRYANNQAIIKKLKDAIANDRIIPYFQPIFSNLTMEIEKYETLIRMIDNEGKVITPYFFLDISKKSRIYRQLTKIMIKKSFKKFRDKDIEFSINLSIEDISDPSMCKYIFQKLESFIRPSNVIFEITESEGVNNYNTIKNFIEEVKEYGAQIAIDDFGSGYSNFMHLLELKADYIKIDGSIIKNINEDKNSQVLTKAIVSMAQELNIKVIAEYVSTEEILNAIKSMCVDYSQGFYLGEPSPDTVK